MERAILEEIRADGGPTPALPARAWATMAGLMLLASLNLLGAAAAFSQRGEPAAEAQAAAVAAAVGSALASTRPVVRLGTATVRSLLTSDGVLWRCSTLNASGFGEAPTPIDVAARVPGVAHEALRAAGLIGDPLYRFNELAYRWVALAQWNLSAEFIVPAGSPLLNRSGAAPSLSLRLSGVDTFCALRLNGEAVGPPLDSALLTHDVRIPPGILRPGPNRLVLAFSPPLAEAALRAASYPYPVPHTLYYHTWSEPSHRNFARKPQSDFGWDWGPSLLPTGVTGRVELRSFGWGEGGLAGVGTAQEHTPQGAVAVRVTGWLEGGEGVDPADPAVLGGLELRVEVCHPSCVGSPAQRVVGRGRLTPPPGHDASAAAGAAGAPPLLIAAPRLWWPRGYGSAELYEVVATLCLRGSPAPCGPPVRRRIGLRRVELVQESAPPPHLGDPNGTSFYFRVNGAAVFVKGANAIPSHVFASAEASAAGDARWRTILRRAAAAHMNMVRVWGGGRYQTDAFYDACDELGLMVWQEFSFACALYPRDAAFLALVRREVVEQTARLALHPSVVVWGGNNENEQALGWYDESRQRRDVYLVDEVKLYLDTVLVAVASADADARPVVDSSPSNGLLSSRPYVKRWGEPQAASWGDIHYYNYEADCEDPNGYPPARFVSEHGFLAWPSLSQYANVSAPEDWSRDSAFSQFRMRHAGGTVQAEAMMRRHFRVPPAAAVPAGRSQAQLFDDWLWLTQAQQARCYETAFARWRRDRSSAAGTMGILYWQLNAIWQGPDWSTLEHDTTLRLAHYAVARVYAPLLLTATGRPPGARAAASPAATNATAGPAVVPLFLDVHLVSDLREAVSGTLAIEVFRWADAPASPVSSTSLRVRVGASTAVRVWTGDVAPMLAGATPAQAFVRLTLHSDADAAKAMAAAGQPPSPLVSFYWLSPLRDATLAIAAPRLVSVERTSDSAAVLRVASNATAALVSAHCEAIPGSFSDGVLTLLGGASPLSMYFEADRPFELAELRECVRFRSLRDTWD